MSYDLIVLGTGGVGSAAMYHATKSGLKVLGLDRFPPGHDRGSSHGETRMIRMSYFEHPNYVPLLQRAYDLWDELAERRGENLFHRTGLLYAGPPDSVIIRGVQESAKEHDLDLEVVSHSEQKDRFTGFQWPKEYTALFEPNAGYLRVEDCVIAHVEEAVQEGAEHRHGETILSWKRDGSGILVTTDRGSYHTEKLIVTAGCWANTFLDDLGIHLRILRKHLHWFEALDEPYHESNGCPSFAFDVGGNFVYGFPKNSPEGVKISEHSIYGTEISNPLEDSREPEADDEARIEAALQAHLPGVSLNRLRHEVCFYTLSPDEHFIIDRLPGLENVAFAAGLSGHGFKCASAIGESLVDLVSGKETVSDIRFLGVDRFR